MMNKRDVWSRGLQSGELAVQMPDFSAKVGVIPVETDIVAVTVYPEQARVTRQGRIEVHQPQVILDIGPLPSTLAPPSVQAYAQGPAQVMLQKPTLAPVPQAADWQRQEEALSDRLRQTEDQFRRCKDNLSGLNQQQTFLQSLSDQMAHTFAQGLAQQSTDLAHVTAFTDFFEQAHRRNSEAIAAQERQKQELDQQLQEARQALQQFQTSGKTPKYRILIPVTVERSGVLDLSIVYDVINAQWQPAYDVRLQADHPGLQIDCIAEVQQDTGEDWHQVALKVSTAVPEKTPAIPDSSLLNIQSALRPKKSATLAGNGPRKVKSRSPVLNEAYRMLGALPGSEIPPHEEEDNWDDAMLQPANAIICFVATNPAQVPSDGEVHRVPVGQLQLDSRLAYVALPQRCSSAYLCAALTNPPEKWPLLPGTAYLFRDGGYVGAEKFEYVAPGASFQLSLGLDERVPIQRELVTQKTVSEDGRDLRAYRLTIHNPFDQAIDVTVIEQIPTGRSGEIEVQITSAKPEIDLHPEDQCQWVMQLAPQASEHIFYQYEIRHAPGDRYAPRP
ncbi:MAG: mucoidy inhibitor MuiA family protein [Cyanobacteria bacterium P01_C01_bin.70]